MGICTGSTKSLPTYQLTFEHIQAKIKALHWRVSSSTLPVQPPRWARIWTGSNRSIRNRSSETGLASITVQTIIGQTIYCASHYCTERFRVFIDLLNHRPFWRRLVTSIARGLRMQSLELRPELGGSRCNSLPFDYRLLNGLHLDGYSLKEGDIWQVDEFG